MDALFVIQSGTDAEIANFNFKFVILYPASRRNVLLSCIA